MMHKCHFISVSFFWFCPEPSQRSESHGLRKMKAAALVHVTLPMFLFLFHWSETPDFSEPKNRPLWTLTQRLTLTFLLSLYRLFSFFFSGGLSLLPVLTCQTKCHVFLLSELFACVREKGRS